MPITWNRDASGKLSPEEQVLATGSTHQVKVKLPLFHVVFHYHDDRPVVGAPFTVELEGGATVEGTLDDKGEADVPVSARPVRVKFGPDSRDWVSLDKDNADFKEDLGDADAFVASRLA